MNKYNDLVEKAKLVRKWSLIATSEAGSGHPTSCLSAADLTTVLFDKYFSYDPQNPLDLTNDRFILSKGHAAPLLYTLFAVSGIIPFEDLRTVRKFGSNLEGHPTPRFKYSDGATGSLGQGLSIGAGIAYGLRSGISNFKFQISNLPKVYVLLGDGELAEGQVWEAANFASYNKLDNLIAILDINKFGQSGETMFAHDLKEYLDRFTAFGFEAIVIDGHDVKAIDSALQMATTNDSGKPYVIIAKTYKGKGISFLENKPNWHGKPLKKEDLEKALKELGDVDDSLRFSLRKPSVILNGVKNLIKKDPSHSLRMTNYKKGEEIATREVYGQVLAELGDSDPLIYALDAEVKNSTFSQDFLKAHPERFIECFIAEQNMVSMAAGLSRLGKKPFVSTFAAFLTRGFDQIRMAAIGKANIRFCGSHSGVSIGEDGPSQMGLEDIAMFGTIPDAVIFHPSDAVSTAKLVASLVNQQGISYLRTLRPATPVLYENNEQFEVGGSKILRSAQNDTLTIVAAGITVHEALKAYEELQNKGISVRIVDCYSIKPIDKKTLVTCLKETKQKTIITVEDHFIHGGLGDFVLDAVSDTGATVKKLAVDHISRSGKKDELLADAGINADSIVKTVTKLLQ
ncbi:MAG TPA: transketolase [Patescibacteria group bacterium]|nr:transketolase [Patescibacteria group bacterium]